MSCRPQDHKELPPPWRRRTIRRQLRLQQLRVKAEFLPEKEQEMKWKDAEVQDRVSVRPQALQGAPWRWQPSRHTGKMMKPQLGYEHLESSSWTPSGSAAANLKFVWDVAKRCFVRAKNGSLPLQADVETAVELALTSVELYSLLVACCGKTAEPDVGRRCMAARRLLAQALPGALRRDGEERRRHASPSLEGATGGLILRPGPGAEDRSSESREGVKVTLAPRANAQASSAIMLRRRDSREDAPQSATSLKAPARARLSRRERPVARLQAWDDRGHRRVIQERSDSESESEEEEEERDRDIDVESESEESEQEEIDVDGPVDVDKDDDEEDSEEDLEMDTAHDRDQERRRHQPGVAELARPSPCSDVLAPVGGCEPVRLPLLKIFEAAMGVGTAPQELELTTVYGRTLQELPQQAERTINRFYEAQSTKYLRERERLGFEGLGQAILVMQRDIPSLSHPESVMLGIRAARHFVEDALPNQAVKEGKAGPSSTCIRHALKIKGVECCLFWGVLMLCGEELYLNSERLGTAKDASRQHLLRHPQLFSGHQRLQQEELLELLAMQHFLWIDLADLDADPAARCSEDRFTGPENSVCEQLLLDAPRELFVIDGVEYDFASTVRGQSDVNGNDLELMKSDFCDQVVSAISRCLGAQRKQLMRAVTSALSQSGLAHLEAASAALQVAVSGGEQDVRFELRSLSADGPWEVELYVRKANFHQCIVYESPSGSMPEAAEAAESSPRTCSPSSFFTKSCRIRYSDTCLQLHDEHQSDDNSRARMSPADAMAVLSFEVYRLAGVGRPPSPIPKVVAQARESPAAPARYAAVESYSEEDDIEAEAAEGDADGMDDEDEQEDDNDEESSSSPEQVPSPRSRRKDKKEEEERRRRQDAAAAAAAKAAESKKAQKEKLSKPATAQSEKSEALRKPEEKSRDRDGREKARRSQASHAEERMKEKQREKMQEKEHEKAQKKNKKKGREPEPNNEGSRRDASARMERSREKAPSTAKDEAQRESRRKEKASGDDKSRRKEEKDAADREENRKQEEARAAKQKEKERETKKREEEERRERARKEEEDRRREQEKEEERRREKEREEERRREKEREEEKQREKQRLEEELRRERERREREEEKRREKERAEREEREERERRREQEREEETRREKERQEREDKRRDEERREKEREQKRREKEREEERRREKDREEERRREKDREEERRREKDRDDDRRRDREDERRRDSGRDDRRRDKDREDDRRRDKDRDNEHRRDRDRHEERDRHEKDRHKDRDKDKYREKDRGRERERSRDRDDRERERDRGREKDSGRDRDRSKPRERERSKQRERSRPRDRERDREDRDRTRHDNERDTGNKDRAKERERERERDKDRARERERERDRDRDADDRRKKEGQRHENGSKKARSVTPLPGRTQPPPASDADGAAFPPPLPTSDRKGGQYDPERLPSSSPAPAVGPGRQDGSALTFAKPAARASTTGVPRRPILKLSSDSASSEDIAKDDKKPPPKRKRKGSDSDEQSGQRVSRLSRHTRVRASCMQED
eukprot:s1297_g18.t3